jgi:hypothetical protein
VSVMICAIWSILSLPFTFFRSFFILKSTQISIIFIAYRIPEILLYTRTYLIIPCVLSRLPFALPLLFWINLQFIWQWLINELVIRLQLKIHTFMVLSDQQFASYCWFSCIVGNLFVASHIHYYIYGSTHIWGGWQTYLC